MKKILILALFVLGMYNASAFAMAPFPAILGQILFSVIMVLKVYLLSFLASI